MKKIFLSAAIVFAAALTFAGGLRIDLRGLPANVQPQDLPAGISVRTLTRGGQIVRSISYPAGNEWKEFTFAVTSPEACKITMIMRGTSDNFVVVDDITAENARIANGDFESFDARRGRPALWKCSKRNYENKVVKSGKAAAKVAYKAQMYQANIAVPANTKVVVKGFYRLLDTNAKPAAAEKGKKKSK